ncbi:MAG: hypothetical protein H8E17_05510 [Deltaproteobacteria bacterium]|nr:hypothetical protein [Deltaproteobacteria bacterium]
MKQKYVISRDTEKKELVIKEYAELDKDILTLVCEETYSDKSIESAIRKSREALLFVIRTEKLYPPVIYADAIANSVIRIYDSKNNQSEELFFDDLDFISKDREKRGIERDLEDKTADVDDLLEDRFDDDYEEKNAINNLNSTLKVAEDEISDVDDDN